MALVPTPKLGVLFSHLLVVISDALLLQVYVLGLPLDHPLKSSPITLLLGIGQLIV